MGIEDELEELEEDFEQTEKQFEKVKEKDNSGSVSEKEEKASNLIKEIRGQLEFLRDQVDNSEDF